MMIVAALCVRVSCSYAGYAARVGVDQPSAVTAIDVLLDPDATMTQHAQAANQRLREVFPKGFALDDSHHPHVTCLQRYVRTADLAQVYAAIGKVLAEEKPTSWKLTASGYFYVTWVGIGLAGIVIEPAEDLVRFQRKLVDAVAPLTVETGTAAAFITTKDAPDINEPTIDYVRTFVPNVTGASFRPHVTIGLAPPDYLNRLLAETFEKFTFSPAGVSVYQVGNFGTARKKLESWDR